jgi:hypothetical protein
MHHRPGRSALVTDGSGGKADNVSTHVGTAVGTRIRVADDVAGGVTTRVRLPYLDNLRTAMVGWIIGGHALLGYAVIGGWPYDEVHEVTFAPRFELALVAVLGPTALFLMGSFFFLSGLVSQETVDREGPARFATGRLLRLGVPFVVFLGLVWPFFMWLAYVAAGHHVSYWWAFRHRHPFLDSGPLWFAEVLLYVSLGYAGWRWLTARGGREAFRSPVAALRGGHLIAVALGVAAVSFLVRLWFPARSTQIFDLHLWQWPQCVGMFGLGVAGGRSGWRVHLPQNLRRACGWATAVTLGAIPALAAAFRVGNVAADAGPFVGGWHWQALVLDGVEAALVVAGSVWLFGVAQSRLTGTGPRRSRWARGSYAAFALQAPVLLTLAIALRPLPWPAEAKAGVVAALGVPVSFWLATHLLRTRLRRVL